MHLVILYVKQIQLSRSITEILLYMFLTWFIMYGYYFIMPT